MPDRDLAPDGDLRRLSRVRWHEQAGIQDSVLRKTRSLNFFPTVDPAVEKVREITAQAVRPVAGPFRQWRGEFNVLRRIECAIAFVHAAEAPRKRKLIAFGHKLIALWQSDAEIPRKVERLDALLPRLPGAKDFAQRARFGVGLRLIHPLGRCRTDRQQFLRLCWRWGRLLLRSGRFRRLGFGRGKCTN